jgi:hypothetical protein
MSNAIVTQQELLLFLFSQGQQQQNNTTTNITNMGNAILPAANEMKQTLHIDTPIRGIEDMYRD